MINDARISLVPIEGAVLIGDVAIVTGGTVDYNTGNWVGGVDNSDGYVIVGNVETAGLVGRTKAGGIEVVGPSPSPTFWKSKALSNEAFIELANKLPGTPGNFVDFTTATDWVRAQGKYLITNDYNTGSGSKTGDYRLSLAYAPAPMNGDITFPAHPSGGTGGTGFANDDPNLVGTNDGTYSYQIYINTNDITGADQSTILNKLVGKSGILTLTQNSNYVEYAFTQDAFKTGGYGGQVVYYDSIYGSPTSPQGSLTVTHGADSPFNTNDPITITIINQ